MRSLRATNFKDTRQKFRREDGFSGSENRFLHRQMGFYGVKSIFMPRKSFLSSKDTFSGSANPFHRQIINFLSKKIGWQRQNFRFSRKNLFAGTEDPSIDREMTVCRPDKRLSGAKETTFIADAAASGFELQIKTQNFG